MKSSVITILIIVIAGLAFWLGSITANHSTKIVVPNSESIEQPVASPLATETPPSTHSSATEISENTVSENTVVASALDSHEERIINVYEKSADSVVSIVVRSTVYSLYSTFEQEGEGSGFIIDNQGHIITNFHVIDGAEDIDVVFSDGQSYPATVRGKDPSNDLALLQLREVPRDVPPALPLGDGNTLRVGQRTIAIGNPFGYFGQTLTTGVISALNRTIPGQEGSDSRTRNTIYDIVQTDAAINRGNSGGPLLNSSGEVIGINTAIYSPSGTNTGVGFAVSVETLKRVVPDLMNLGYYRNPSLGIDAGYALDSTIARELYVPSEQGILLVSLANNSPLLELGIKGGQEERILRGQTIYLGGDIILAVDNQPINSIRELRDVIVNNYVVGDTINVRVLQSRRNGTWQETTLPVRLQAAQP